MVLEHIDRSRFTPYLVHIEREGWWAEDPDSGKRVEVQQNNLGCTLDGGQVVKADVAFIMVHGTPGEDGLLQAHLDLCGIPHTTANARVMATTFHKGWTTALLRDAGIAVAQSVECMPSETWDAARVDAVVGQLGLPCFVKPNESGSSIGISRVTSSDELWPAVVKARETGTSTVLVESLLRGGNSPAGSSPTDEEASRLARDRDCVRQCVFDYAAKYNGQSREITPADLGPEDTGALQRLALRVYKTMHLEGMARST